MALHRNQASALKLPQEPPLPDSVRIIAAADVPPNSVAANDLQMSFGHCLKSLRRRLLTKQLWLSGEIGCTDAAISFWETGRRLPEHESLSRLIEAFRKSGASAKELTQLRFSWQASLLRRSSGRWPAY